MYVMWPRLLHVQIARNMTVASRITFNGVFSRCGGFGHSVRARGTGLGPDISQGSWEQVFYIIFIFVAFLAIIRMIKARRYL